MDGSLPGHPERDRDGGVHEAARRCAPSCETMIASTRPCASATPVRSSWPSRSGPRAGPDEDERERRRRTPRPPPCRCSPRFPLARRCVRRAAAVAARRRVVQAADGPPRRGRGRCVVSMPAVDVLLVSPDPASRELMALAVRSIERRVGRRAPVPGRRQRRARHPRRAPRPARDRGGRRDRVAGGCVRAGQGAARRHDAVHRASS